MIGNLETIGKINQQIKHNKVAMLTTKDPSGDVHGRPVMTQDIDYDGNVWFFSKRNSEKIREIELNPTVNLTFSDDETYVSIDGEAEIVTDVQLKKELWNESLRLWFDQGPESPDVILLRVRSQQIQ